MDIGTAKPSLSERGRVSYFGIDLAEPDEPFSAGAWLSRVRVQLAAARCPAAVCQAVPSPGSLIVAGGTGLYVRALIQGLEASAADPERRRYWQERLTREGIEALRSELVRRAPQALAQLADPDNPRRVIRALEHLDAAGSLPEGWGAAPRPRLVGLRLPRAALQARIAARVERMFADGLLDEVAALRARFPETWGTDSHLSGKVRIGGDAPSAAGEPSTLPTAQQAIGYAEAGAVLDNRLTRAQAVAQIVLRTRQLAKRQETWFRHQAEVTWLDIEAEEPAAAIAARLLAVWREHGPTPIRLS